jgi:hypothetical protein
MTKRFTDVTSQTGIHSSAIAGYGLIAVSDINMDILVPLETTFTHENDYLYISTRGWNFWMCPTDSIMHTNQFFMGVDVLEYK